MAKFYVILISIILLSAISCSKNGPECNKYYCDQECPNRTGALCNDGTISTSVGSGTCSHHGGVDQWICDTTICE